MSNLDKTLEIKLSNVYFLPFGKLYIMCISYCLRNLSEEYFFFFTLFVAHYTWWYLLYLWMLLCCASFKKNWLGLGAALLAESHKQDSLAGQVFGGQQRLSPLLGRAGSIQRPGPGKRHEERLLKESEQHFWRFIKATYWSQPSLEGSTDVHVGRAL